MQNNFNKKKQISAVKLIKFYLDTKTDIKTRSFQQMNQVLNVNTVRL